MHGRDPAQLLLRPVQSTSLVGQYFWLPKLRFHTDQVKEWAQLHKRGKPSDDQAPAPTAGEPLAGPPQWSPAPAGQENTSGLCLRVSAAVCFGWETDLVHDQRWRTVRQRPSFPVAFWYVKGLSVHSVKKAVQVARKGTWGWSSSALVILKYTHEVYSLLKYDPSISALRVNNTFSVYIKKKSYSSSVCVRCVCVCQGTSVLIRGPPQVLFLAFCFIWDWALFFHCSLLPPCQPATSHQGNW